MLPRLFATLLLTAAAAFSAPAAEPLSKSYALDFYRDIPSRNLNGLATRSDGRLIAGPVLTDLAGPALPQLLWCLEPAGENRWLVGTGPDGRIFEVTLDPAARAYTAREVARLEEPQVLALKRLPDGSLLAGTSPNGTLVLLRDGKIVSSAALPADSIFDLCVRGDQAYVATGNPARVYQVDLKSFSAAGIDQGRSRDLTQLKARGISVFAEVRDRNIRRIAWVGDHLIAGSSPKGNIYSIAAAGGAPQLLQENRDAEVAALLPGEDGDFHAALVFSSTQGEARINRPNTGKGDANSDLPPASPIDRFAGRSAVVYFPRNGFPETLVSRSGVAFYALAKAGDTLLIAGGEQGDVLGYELSSRQSLSYSGSDSAQLNALAPLSPAGSSATAGASRFLALRNNVPGLALIDFTSGGPRSAETRRLDLGVPSTLGALRIGRLINTRAENVTVQFKGNAGSDELEGWSPWTPATRKADGWTVPDFHARNVKLRIQVAPDKAASPELDSATLYYLPQNRRPLLGEFRIVTPNYTLLHGPEPAPATVTTLTQLLASMGERDKPKNPILNYNVAPQPGNQLVTWTISDPDNDTLTCDFDIRREGDDRWIPLAVDSRENFVQFDTSHLEDGVYLTRLTAREQAPRPAAERLSVTFDTEDLVIDHTPPELVELTQEKSTDGLTLSVTGHDALSLLDRVEFNFNNGYREAVAQPADGIRDSQTETFVFQSLARNLAGATSVEIVLFDFAGNTTARRVDLK
jgi:hypothetical protein